MSWPCLGLRLALLALGAAGAPEEKKAVPVYTNDDLDRVAPLRDQTGVSSTVAPGLHAPVAAAAPDDGRAKSQAYWRRETERTRAQLQRTRDRIADLRSRIAAAESQSQSRPRSDDTRMRGRSHIETWQRQIAVLEERARETEAAFLDRARRGGALPGWVR